MTSNQIPDMIFASDNAGPVHPKVMDALAVVNSGYAMAYGNDDLTARVENQIRNLFEAPNAAVFLVPTGTAANSLALAALCTPWSTVFCAPVAHIEEDECNAPEFYTGGAKLTLVPTDEKNRDQMTPDALRATIRGAGNSVHNAQRGAVSITQVGEMGNVYTIDEIKALCDVAKDFDLPIFLDGARLSNAIAKLGCAPAEMSWKAGVDVVAFGGTKNGLMAVEAVIFFDPKQAEDFAYRRKRGAQLFSKHRYLAAQMSAYLENSLWLEMANSANARMAEIVSGLTSMRVSVNTVTPANLIFFTLPRHSHRAILDGGAVYYTAAAQDGPDDALLTGRLVCDWSMTQEAVTAFLDLVRRSI